MRDDERQRTQDVDLAGFALPFFDDLGFALDRCLRWSLCLAWAFWAAMAGRGADDALSLPTSALPCGIARRSAWASRASEANRQASSIVREPMLSR